MSPKTLLVLSGMSGMLLVMLSASSLAQEDVEAARVYAIDAENSILRVFVGRAGILARMGHNHVVHTRSLEGEIVLAPDLMNSSATFSFPVDSFVVDDPAERERAGDDFDSQPGESAIAGTRENMLGEDVLNAANYPDISVELVPVSTDSSPWLLDVSISIQGRRHRQEIPAVVEISDSGMRVNASFRLQHDDLGLSPFSAVGGSLRVAETLDFELEVSALAR